MKTIYFVFQGRQYCLDICSFTELQEMIREDPDHKDQLIDNWKGVMLVETPAEFRIDQPAQ